MYDDVKVQYELIDLTSISKSKGIPGGRSINKQV